MRVANSTSLTELLGEMGPTSPSTQAGKEPESQSFAGEMEAASRARAAPASVQPKTEQAPKTEQPILERLISLAVADSKGESKSAQPAPLPLCSSNQVFNLVTDPASAGYANECRAAVDAELRALGMDLGQFRMSYWEEAVGYPGGGYMNRCITVETSEGYRMDFDAAATLRNPRVTAAGIQLLKSGYWNAAAAVTS